MKSSFHLSAAGALVLVAGLVSTATAQIISGTPGAASISNVQPGNALYDINPASFWVTGRNSTILSAPPSGLFTGTSYDGRTDRTTIGLRQPRNSAFLVYGDDEVAVRVGRALLMYTPVSNFSVTRGSEFVIGYMTMFNGSVAVDSDVDSFTVSFDSGVSDPSFAGASTFGVSILNTLNRRVNYWADADIYSFGIAGGKAVQIQEGEWGTIELYGRFNSPFTPTRFGNAVDFAVLEDGSFTVGALTGDPTIRAMPLAVPEPGTYGLLAVLSLAVLVARRYRK